MFSWAEKEISALNTDFIIAHSTVSHFFREPHFTAERDNKRQKRCDIKMILMIPLGYKMKERQLRAECRKPAGNKMFQTHAAVHKDPTVPSCNT